MNKSELIKNLSEETNLPPEEATLVVNTFVDCMKESLLAN
jgi:integration host factor subunit beta